MATSFGALCNTFYINQKMALKMDLPHDRETILHLFDSIRKGMPEMDRFRRYRGELALESSRKHPGYRWLALRQNSIRTGYANPPSMADGYALHRLILQTAPYHLSISPLDVDYMELLFGFDLESEANHDEIIANALYSHGPLAELVRLPDARLTDLQPVLGFVLSNEGDLQCHVEVKTRRRGRRGNAKRYRTDPLSIFLTLRKYGPFDKVEDLPEALDKLAARAEAIAVDRVVPHLLTPIARHITSGSA